MIVRTSFANNKLISLELHEVFLTDALYTLAKFLKRNLILSPHIKGEITLTLHEAMPDDVFELLLTAHDLAKREIAGVWYIAPREELIKQEEAEWKWRTKRKEITPFIMRTWQIHYAKANEIANLLKANRQANDTQRIWADARTNRLYAKAHPSELAEIARLLREFDVPIKQIVIEARLATVDYDYERELGINFSSKVAVRVSQNDTAAILGETHHYPILAAKLAANTWLDVKLSALENAGHAKLISSPRLFTSNQQTASIEAGEEVPYQEMSESGGTTVVFKKAVLGLKVTPQILPNHRVLLQLQINQDRPSNKMVLGVPTISTRQMTTEVLLKSGQTLVLGGIYESNEEKGEKRVPWLSQIPLIGVLFSEHHQQRTKRELLIFVTPKIYEDKTK